MLPDATSASLVLRPVNDADSDFLLQLYASTRADEMALVDWSEQQKFEFLHMQFNAQSSYYFEQFAAASFDVIELDGKPVGRLYVDERADELRVIDIALMPEFRQQGIGAYYMQSILDRAAASGRAVGIHVEKNNPAMRLYDRLGFEQIEDKGVYWFMRCKPAKADQEKTAS